MWRARPHAGDRSGSSLPRHLESLLPGVRPVARNLGSLAALGGRMSRAERQSHCVSDADASLGVDSSSRRRTMGRKRTRQVRVGRAFPLALCVLGAGSLLPACSSSGLARKGSADGSSQSDRGAGGAGGTSGTGGVTGSGGMPSTGGATSSGKVTPAGGTTASSPVDAGFYQAVDAPQADAPQAGSGGNGGITASGGATRTGGATGAGGAPASSAADAGLDGRADGEIDAKSVDAFPGTDTAVNSCENPLPLKCGDRLYHNTLIQGRPNVLGFYGCSERVMSGPETIYFLAPPAGCQATV